MGKALMVLSTQTALANNSKGNFFGTDGFAVATEADAQAQATEQVTFSNLGINVISGNSASMTLTFRNKGVNGNQAVSFSSTAAQSDAINSDIVSSGELFNFIYTDTGTNSDFAWIKENVEFASGHGNFHGASNFAVGPIYDLDGLTRFIPFSGPLNADGASTEANVQWKNRGYTSLETFQVRVSANVRSQTTIESMINGVPGNLSVTITASAGAQLYVATGTPDAIVDGDLVCLRISYGAGTDDMNISHVMGTFKSSDNKSESFFGGGAFGIAWSATATEAFMPIGGRVTQFVLSEAQARIPVGFDGVLINPRVYLSNNNYGSNATLNLYRNGSAAAAITLTQSGGAGWYEASTSVAFASADEFSFGISGGTSGRATFHAGGLTFAPSTGAATVLLMLSPNLSGNLDGVRSFQT